MENNNIANNNMMMMQNLFNLKMQLASIDFQFNSLLTQIQNIGMISNINMQINNLSFQIFNFGIQLQKLGMQADKNIINKSTIKEQFNYIINQLNIILEDVSLQEQPSNSVNEIKNKFEDSTIINKKEYDMISDWISPNKKIELNLLYRASRDGDKPKDFHDKCDNKGRTFSIFHLENGYIIGGYSSISWKNYGGAKKDSKAFICS